MTRLVPWAFSILTVCAATFLDLPEALLHLTITLATISIMTLCIIYECSPPQPFAEREVVERCAQIAEKRIADAPDGETQEIAHKHGKAIAAALRDHVSFILETTPSTTPQDHIPDAGKMVTPEPNTQDAGLVEEALRRLELACDGVAGQTSSKRYQTDLSDILTEKLLELDEARRMARYALKAQEGQGHE